MEVVLSHSAKAEVAHAARYYEAEVEGLERAFLSSIEAILAEIERFRVHPETTGHMIFARALRRAVGFAG